MKRLLLIPLIAMALMASSCEQGADVAKRNIATAADNFEVQRKIIFLNVWTNEAVLQVVGKCSMDIATSKLILTCKNGPDDYKSHTLGRSTNLSFFSEQLDPISVSEYHTRITWRPQTLIPDIDVQFSGEELLTNKNTDG